MQPYATGTDFFSQREGGSCRSHGGSLFTVLYVYFAALPLVRIIFSGGRPVHAFDVQQGQFFRKGQLIAAIDERDFVIQKQRTEALYRQAEVDYARISSLYEAVSK